MVLPSPEKMAVYRASARKRQLEKRQRWEQRYHLGRAIAKQASGILKQEFHADRVVLFGSMLSEQQVHGRSDVDLAVWGLKPQDYFRALGQLLSLNPDIPVDLLEVETAPARIREQIETQGLDL
jgi:predicted nucleotidyltransferase